MTNAAALAGDRLRAVLAQGDALPAQAQVLGQQLLECQALQGRMAALGEGVGIGVRWRAVRRQQRLAQRRQA